MHTFHRQYGRESRLCEYGRESNDVSMGSVVHPVLHASVDRVDDCVDATHGIQLRVPLARA